MLPVGRGGKVEAGKLGSWPSGGAMNLVVQVV